MRRNIGAAGAWLCGVGAFDASPGAALVGPGVEVGWVGIGDFDALDVETIATSWRRDRCLPSTPGVVVVWVPGIPQAKTDLHGALRVLVVGSLAIGGFQGTHHLAVKQPGNGSRRPINGVGVESCHGAADSRAGRVVVGPRDCLAKIIGLHDGVIRAAPLPINLIEIVGEEHDTADDAAARSSLSNNINATEQKVPIGPHGG